MTTNWRKQLIHWKEGLPVRVSEPSWRNEPTELHELQQRQMGSAGPGTEQPHASVLGPMCWGRGLHQKSSVGVLMNRLT